MRLLNYLIIFFIIVLLFGCISFQRRNTDIIDNKYKLRLVSDNDINNINLIKSIPFVENVNTMVETNINKLQIPKTVSEIQNKIILSNHKDKIRSDKKTTYDIGLPWDEDAEDAADEYTGVCNSKYHDMDADMDLYPVQNNSTITFY
jgi:hypothetical protein